MPPLQDRKISQWLVSVFLSLCIVCYSLSMTILPQYHEIQTLEQRVASSSEPQPLLQHRPSALSEAAFYALLSEHAHTTGFKILRFSSSEKQMNVSLEGSSPILLSLLQSLSHSTFSSVIFQFDSPHKVLQLQLQRVVMAPLPGRSVSSPQSFSPKHASSSNNTRKIIGQVKKKGIAYCVVQDNAQTSLHHKKGSTC